MKPPHTIAWLAVAASMLLWTGCAAPDKPHVVRQFPPAPVYPPDHRYSLDELIELSIHHNAALDAARHTTEAAEGLVDQVKALWLPQLRYDFIAAGYSNDLSYRVRALGLVSVNVPLTGAYNINNTAALAQIVATFGKRTSVLRQVKDLAAIQRLAVLMLEDAIAFQVANLYFLVGLTNDVDAVLEETLRRVRVFRQVAHELNQQGSLRASRLDTRQADLLITQIEQLRILTRTARQQAYQALRTFIGVPHDQPLMLRSASLPPPLSTMEVLGSAATLAQGFARRPELRQVDLLVDLFHQQVRFAKSAWAPNIAFLGTATYTTGRPNAILNAVQGLIGTLVLDLPIYDPARRGQLRFALGLERATLALQREIEQLITLEIEVSRLQAQKCLAMVFKAVQTRQVAIEHEQLARQAYSREIIQANQVIVAIALDMAARLEYLQTVYGFQCSRANLKRVTGERGIRYGF